MDWDGLWIETGIASFTRIGRPVPPSAEKIHLTDDDYQMTLVNFPKIIRPALFCKTLVTLISTFLPT